MTDISTNFTNEQINELIQKVYDGEISVESLPKGLYLSIAERFKKSLEAGYGKKLSQLTPGSEEYEVVNSMMNNLYSFSAAKTFQIVNELQELANADISKEVYDEQAKGIFSLYNDTWGETEANTAEAVSQSADKWREIEANKEALPYLRWNAVVDENTDDECFKLDGLTLPVDDPIWETSNPPLHYNCRCLLEQVDVEQGSPDSDKDKAIELLDDHADTLFDFNAWKEQIVFPEDHPYFDVAKEYDGLKENNFGLPIPKQ